MELDKAILQLYPDTNFKDDVTLQDDGSGAYISQWNRPEIQPTQAELQTAWEQWLTGTVNRKKLESLSHLNTWRSERRAAADLTESMYYEAQRWQADSATPFGLDGQRGRMSREQYAGWVIKTWDKIEADYSLAVSLVKQAKTVDEIAIILERRG